MGWGCKNCISQLIPRSCSYLDFQFSFQRPYFNALRADLYFPAGQQATGRIPRQLLASRYSGGVLISSPPVVRVRNEPLRPAGALNSYARRLSGRFSAPKRGAVLRFDIPRICRRLLYSLSGTDAGQRNCLQQLQGSQSLVTFAAIRCRELARQKQPGLGWLRSALNSFVAVRYSALTATSDRYFATAPNGVLGVSK